CSRQLDFRTGPARTTCGADHPTLLTPKDGATVSGIVGVTAQLAPDDNLACPNTLETYVVGVALDGEDGFQFYVLAFSAFPWDTTHFPNGRYRLSAQKACQNRGACGGISDSIEVTIRNP